MIHINSNGGRIGRIWWFNSDSTPRRFTFPHDGFVVTMELEQWGTFGFGGQVTIDEEWTKLRPLPSREDRP